ncbi:hypothetical protein [Nocardioides sp.]|uniref:hypothetical protein n=1 Tax=Nocardioides sp. TaxID=35761 RepID=UPI003561E206
MASHSIRSRLTYANVVATLALVVAMGGTGAYAAQLGKNTVASKQVKNNSLTGKDIKDGKLTGADVAKDSLTGAQVKESTLGPVPNASKLGGQPAAVFNRNSKQVKGTFTEGNPLVAPVGPFGSVHLFCDDKNTVGNLTDDVMGLGYQINTGPSGVAMQRAAFSPTPLTPPTWVLYNSFTSGSGTSVDKNSHVFSEWYLSNATGSLAYLARMWGYNDSGAFGCNGIIEVTRMH